MQTCQKGHHRFGGPIVQKKNGTAWTILVHTHPTAIAGTTVSVEQLMVARWSFWT